MRPITWILSLMLLLAPSLAPAAHTVLVKAETLTMREKPSKTGKAVDKLIAFQPVELLKTEGDWAQVKTAKNQTGYVLASYLTPNAFVYTGEDKVNGRYGYGTQYDTIIVYEQPHLPLRVLDATDNGWLMVMDYDGDRSWVYSKGVTTSGRYVITKEPNCNVRKGVGIGQDLVFTAQKGVILKVLEEKDGWLHVKHTDGDEGWLSAKTVFGWLDVDVPASGKASDSTGSGKTSSPAKAGSRRGSSEDAADTGSKVSSKKKASGSSDETDDTASKATSRKKKGAGSSTRRTKRSSSSDDAEESGSGKSSTRSSVAKAGSTRAVSLRSASKASGSESSGSTKTGSRRTRSRKTPSTSDE